jgi:transposase
MAKVYRAYLPEQDLLLPQNVRDWLPEDHLAHFVSDVVDQLDLTAIESGYEEGRGYPPYHPRMMTKILLYGYCVGVFSSRRIQKKLVEDVGFRMLAAGNEPDFRTISDFRKLHLKALQGMFDQVLQISLKAGAMKLGRVVLDGSKVKANASKHKAMSYGRMKEEEKRLKAEVRRMLEEAAAVDEEEDSGYGKNRRGDELPAELARRETRLEKIREAKQAVEERAREKAASQGKSEAGAEPEDKAQYNFTDPESRIMKGPDGFVQAYNTQIAVEPDLQLIVGQRVTQAANDKQQLQPMVEAMVEQAGQKPQEIIGDSGYCSDQNLQYLENKRMTGFVAVDRESYRDRNQTGPRGPLPKGATRTDRMRRKLQTKAGAAVYSIRKTVVEPVFGQIKQARGFRQFLLRGFEKTQGEWAMVCLTHNILKLHRLCYP